MAFFVVVALVACAYSRVTADADVEAESEMTSPERQPGQA